MEGNEWGKESLVRDGEGLLTVYHGATRCAEIAEVANVLSGVSEGINLN